jgi:hypothetical protein
MSHILLMEMGRETAEWYKSDSMAKPLQHFGNSLAENNLLLLALVSTDKDTVSRKCIGKPLPLLFIRELTGREEGNVIKPNVLPAKSLQWLPKPIAWSSSTASPRLILLLHRLVVSMSFFLYARRL